MVDYSKWDKFNVGDDEDESFNTGPAVKVLNKGDKIQIGPNGSSLVKNEKTAPTTNLTAVKEPGKQNQDDDAHLHLNGSKCEHYLWSQTATEVILRIPVDNSISSKSARISVNEKTIAVYINGTCILNHELRYSIELREAIDGDGNFIDWELLTIKKQKYIIITLQKKEVIPGAIFWWDKCFIHESTIDVTQIKDRKKVTSTTHTHNLSHDSKISNTTTTNNNTNTESSDSNNGTNSATTSSSSKSFSDVWKEAHEMFKEKMKNKNVQDSISVDI